MKYPGYKTLTVKNFDWLSSFYLIIISIFILNNGKIPEIFRSYFVTQSNTLDGATIVCTSTNIKLLDLTLHESNILKKRFGAHGPQSPVNQYITSMIDSITPLKFNTIMRLQDLKPYILKEANSKQVNPILLLSILFDEIHHRIVGEDCLILVHIGFLRTLGPSQLSINELIHQELIPLTPLFEQVTMAREMLLNTENNIGILANEINRFKNILGFHVKYILKSGGGIYCEKALATVAYMHNGKADYAYRVLQYMKDHELINLVFG
uniref:Uncharacterized protein n=1 Tax=Paulinella longichromatophora TaxID=1708747 RepID=A0A2H4ZNQ9_9EUKA|nr:hypothetical protein PLO_176 [Paulinella longichromatophora]